MVSLARKLKLHSYVRNAHSHRHSCCSLSMSPPSSRFPCPSLSFSVYIRFGFFGDRKALSQYAFFRLVWCAFFYCVVHCSCSSKSRNYLVCMLLFGQNERASLFIYFGFNILPIWKIRFNDFVFQLARENGRIRSRYSTKPHLNLDICAQFRISDCSYRIQPIFICVK